MLNKQTNSAKFTFFYLISLISLIFVVISTGNIIFQLINKYVVDIIHTYSGEYSTSSLKFAISSLIIGAPIYYLSVRQINKNLLAGKLPIDSGIRRWLTYLILLASSVTAIGWLIAILYSFLDGDLTLKFALKTLTALTLAGIVAGYYFFDIRREKIKDKHNKTIKYYFYATLSLIIAALILGLFFVESPKETRQRKLDNLILEKFDNIEYALDEYYLENQKLPDNLETLKKSANYPVDDYDIRYGEEENLIEYKIISEEEYALCAKFNLSNERTGNIDYGYRDKEWPHASGYQCLSNKIYKDPYLERLPIRDLK